MQVRKNIRNKVFAVDRYRVLAGMTQEDLCRETGMGRTFASFLETLTYDDLDRIASVLDVSESQLFCKRDSR